MIKWYALKNVCAYLCIPSYPYHLNTCIWNLTQHITNSKFLFSTFIHVSMYWYMYVCRFMNFSIISLPSLHPPIVSKFITVLAYLLDIKNNTSWRIRSPYLRSHISNCNACHCNTQYTHRHYASKVGWANIHFAVWQFDHSAHTHMYVNIYIYICVCILIHIHI